MSHLPPPAGLPRDGIPPSAGLPLASYTPPAPMKVRVWPFLVGLSALATGVVVGLLISAWSPAQTQYFHDASVAWSDPISDKAAAVVAATGMSFEGELVYRASRPAIEDDDSFNEHCALEGGAVLGCYAAGTIYVYDVTDERLAGTVEVTAAHEMLHAAYERLTAAERTEADRLVADFVASLPDDDPTYADLELYAPEQFDDEWHSRLATEYADLSPELEAHYARWFDDRVKVVALHVQANAAFLALQEQIDALVAEVDTLGPAIDARIAAHESALAGFNADVASFNSRAENGGFETQAQFDRERGLLVSRSAALDAEVDAINAEVERYNGLIAQLTALDADYADLYSALDSTSGADAP